MDTLLAKINNPIVVYIILGAVGLWWLLPKYKEVQAWKELFSKGRSEELKKAREDVKDVPEETAFYDEALREELFRKATGIDCGKKNRQMYQKLVTDGVTTVKGIRYAWTYIYVNNRRVEVKLIWVERIMEALLYLAGIFGILAIFVSLVNIESFFDLSEYPNILFLLSTGILCVFFALQQLLPMLFARAIRKRLKDKEQEEACSSASSTEESSSPVQSEEV
jgi:hypothetical protein